MHIVILEDFDKKSEKGEWIKSWSVPTGIVGIYQQHRTLSGNRWNRIQNRSNPNGIDQKKHPTYLGTENRFNDFQSFVEWSRSEVGYQLKDCIAGGSRVWSIDKDILIPGNKVYSEQSCMFIPHRVNTLILSCNSARGEYPVGVYFSQSKNRYIAECRTDKKSKYLGCFTDPFEAHRAWQNAKVAFGRSVSDDYKSIHKKLYNGLNSWLDVIQQDYENHRETTFL